MELVVREVKVHVVSYPDPLPSVNLFGKKMGSGSGYETRVNETHIHTGLSGEW